jgi:hypothetical protein
MNQWNSIIHKILTDEATLAANAAAVVKDVNNVALPAVKIVCFNRSARSFM